MFPPLGEQILERNQTHTTPHTNTVKDCVWNKSGLSQTLKTKRRVFSTNGPYMCNVIINTIKQIPEKLKDNHTLFYVKHAKQFQPHSAPPGL